MAEASISLEQDQFSCPICLDLCLDPVTIPCGHSFCKVCINKYWDQEDQGRVYNCPQCRETFTPRPVLGKNNMLAKVVENLKKRELQAASADHRSTKPDLHGNDTLDEAVEKPKKTELQAGDVKCDFCTETKLKAIKFCQTCLASLCKTHCKSHRDVPAFKKHKLVDVSSKHQEKICSEHHKLVEIYCRTDQSVICYSCEKQDHRGHDTVEPAAERRIKQSELEEVQRKLQQRLHKTQKKMEEVKRTMKTLKRSAKAAVEDSEKIFNELNRFIEKKRSEVKKLIRDQEKAEVSRAEGVLEKLEQEIADLKRRDAELEQLLDTEDHIHFLQNFQSLCGSSGSEDSTSSSVHQHPSFDGVRKSLSELKERLEEFCRKEFNKIPPHAAASQNISPSEPKTREDFLKYFCNLTLDPNSAHCNLSLSEENRVVRYSDTQQSYSVHPERFDCYSQVLCKESVCGRRYWEVEWSSSEGWVVSISVSYKEISRKGRGNECGFGLNNQSWRLRYSSALHFYHNNKETGVSEPPSCRIGVYVDHSAGILSFYRVSEKMTLLHRVYTTFTQPLYAGFRVYGSGSTLRLCDLK